MCYKSGSGDTQEEKGLNTESGQGVEGIQAGESSKILYEYAIRKVIRELLTKREVTMGFKMFSF